MSGLDEAPVSSSVQSFVLDLPPSCIEFCPAFPSYFLVGTYNLQKDEEASNTAAQENDESESDDESRQAAVAAKPQNRNGSILVYQLVNDTMYVPSHCRKTQYKMNIHASVMVNTYKGPCSDRNAAIRIAGPALQPSGRKAGSMRSCLQHCHACSVQNDTRRRPGEAFEAYQDNGYDIYAQARR